jgi:uncharacterized protein YndB with AHSA1/START domain
MPRVSRSRTIPRPPDEVRDLVSDPYHLPRWWPKAERVENVRGSAPVDSWTLVYLTQKGKPVRADYRRVDSDGQRFAFEQDVEGTPFAGILRNARTQISVEPADGGSRVRIELDQTLRGLSRFGGPMVRRATGRQLDAALDGLESALGIR